MTGRVIDRTHRQMIDLNRLSINMTRDIFSWESIYTPLKPLYTNITARAEKKADAAQPHRILPNPNGSR